MALDFLPFVDGQKVTAAEWNSLFDAIADGSFFTGTTALSGTIATLTTRLEAVEIELAYVKAIQGRQFKREQFELTAEQAVIGLQATPMQDSEVCSLGGIYRSKTGYPTGFVGDYSITGSTITLNPELAAGVKAGDVFIAVYQYEVDENV